MSVLVDEKKCRGCGTCVDTCPGDLLMLDPVRKTPEVREASDCWDCMSCVKSCPEGALETHLPYEIALYGASLRPEVTPQFITWTLRYGETERKFVSRRSWLGV